MTKTVDKEKFINAAQNLAGAYEDYGLGYYTIAEHAGILEEVNEYLMTQAKDSYDFDDEFYKLFIKANPNPQVIILDD